MQVDKANPTTATFFTQTKTRPQTSHISRNKSQLRQQFSLDPQVDPSAKLKSLKQQLKKLQQTHLDMITRVNDSKKVIDKQYRYSQQRKVQFLNLYEQRKVRMQEHKMLEQKYEKEQKHKSYIKQRTKSMKLNGQVRALLLRNQIQDNNSLICTQNRRNKQKLKQQLLRQKQTDLTEARKSYARIKASEGDLHFKMQKIGQMQATMAKTNYARKIGEQIQAVQQLDRQLNELCQDEFCDKCIHGQSAFLTQNNN